MSPIRLFALLNPAIGLIFATAFLMLWWNHRERPHILLMAGAAATYAIAVSAQLFLPLIPGVGVNTLGSAFFYLLALGLFIEAILMRVGVRGNVPFILAFAALILALLAFFILVHDSLIIRIYVLNVGAGALLCWAAWRLRRARSVRMIDRALFWIVLLIGLHFLPRTVFTLLADAGTGATTTAQFGHSIFFQVMNFALIILALLLCLTFLLAIALDILEDVRREQYCDSLTPLLNRRGFEAEGQRRLVALHGGRASVVFCDIDHFKSVNDTYGHAAGDEVIRTVGVLIADEIRPSDLGGRIGGEEFVILLPGASLEEGRVLAERLRQRISEASFAALRQARVTASFGVAEAGPDEPLDDVMSRADDKLYAAKRGGRDRVAA
ncbi:GGDEF domain-containing protein [Ancylobacter pratisalsi]|uniref:diguanylate cyclase n=1 Tax=Ancylobacter pratisalsi TaxID=1745854 RepID=A0A6P1YQX3_9HYPH|nr:GGDEF domain-containing protein [Ancylobacter pratisalsi]QIB35887.1 GGDEF domain-containing protein [Ancylobacter pratisalsi]